MVLAGQNGVFNMKSPGAAISVFALIGVACYGWASAGVYRNQGTPSETYNLMVTATGGRAPHSVPLTLTVRNHQMTSPRNVSYSSGSAQFSRVSLTLCRNWCAMAPSTTR